MSDVDTPKARTELYKDGNVEQSQSREEWSKEKTRILDSIDQAVKDHNITIDDSSNQLELAVETIENEQKHQHMRCQIYGCLSIITTITLPVQFEEEG